MMNLKNRAIRLLALREQSRSQLQSKLRVWASATEIEMVLDELEQLKLLDDQRFANAWVRGHAQKFGRQRLCYELQQYGINEVRIALALEQALDESELARAGAVWKKRFGQKPQDYNAYAKQARFLQQRGFSPNIIRQMLKENIDEFTASM